MMHVGDVVVFVWVRCGDGFCLYPVKIFCRHPWPHTCTSSSFFRRLSQYFVLSRLYYPLQHLEIQHFETRITVFKPCERIAAYSWEIVVFGRISIILNHFHFSIPIQIIEEVYISYFFRQDYPWFLQDRCIERIAIFHWQLID